MLILLLIYSIASYHANVKGKLVINTNQGILHGKEVINANGKHYYSFSGVPYAEPPVGSLRFKPPQKLEPWDGIRIATQEADICKQFNIYKNNIEGDEDCLYLNIHVPQASENTSLPVFFWIHGGGFISGSGNSELYGPDFLMEYDIILVTINYRLGPFGFLNLNLEDAPGNMGLLDQVEALRWINKNIAAFGGDPKDITIGGNSAGAASVHYLILSDAAKNLFQKAIMQSGSALNPWAFQKQPLKRAFQLCEALGHPTSNTSEALEILLSTSADNILGSKIPPEVEGQILFDFIFVPSVEKEFSTRKAFITEAPKVLMETGKFNKVPTLMGFNNAEGITFYNYIKADPYFIQKFEEDFEKFIPNDLEIPLKTEESAKLANKMREFYFNNKSVEHDMQGFVNILSDNWFSRGIYDQAKLMVEEQAENIYFYEYCFDEFTLSRNLLGNLDVTGASHMDELVNIFKRDDFDLAQQSKNVITNQRRFLDLWTNFIKMGDPTPEQTDLLPVIWKPITVDDFNFLNIDTEIAIRKDPENERMLFWEEVKCEHKL